MATPSSDVLRGTLDLLVLKTLNLEPMHGWGISQRIGQFSRGVLDVNQGSLYPALQRLELKVDYERVAQHGAQSARQVLPAHAPGPPRVGCRNG
jgi:DNA-binding PadR family transcriptional regulator